MRKQSLRIVLSIFLFAVAVNSLDSQSINTQGRSLVSKNLQVTYSIGDLVIGTSQTSDIYITSGFLDTEFRISSFIERPNLPEIELFPNPFNNFLTVRYNAEDYSELNIELYDILGNLIARLNINESNNLLNFENYSAQTYILKISDNKGDFIKSFIVIKN
jgi:hypothetical protein